MIGERHPWLKSKKNTDRLVFFCDAVFAIAITILILQIDVPDYINTDNPIETVNNLWPAFISFGISFFVIGRFWVTHLHLFSYIRHLDMRLVVGNFIFMAFIVFLPFTTALYSTHSQDLFSLSFYVLSIVATSVASLFMWRYVLSHKELLHEDANIKHLDRKAFVGLLIPAEFLIALVIIYIDPRLIDWYWLFFGLIAVGMILIARLKWHPEKFSKD
ncbi:TMEM175 family protein [Patescibacteria group bacterium]